MHPRDHAYYAYDRQHEHEDQDDEERKGRESSLSPPDAWKEWARTEQDRAVLPLPVGASSSMPPIHSIHYDRRRAELFPTERRVMLPPPPPSTAQIFPNQRQHEFTPHTVFSANTDGPAHQHSHHYQPQHPIDPYYYHNQSSQLPRYRAVHTEPSRSPPRAGKASLAFILDNHSSARDDTDERMAAEHSLTQLHLHDSSSRDDDHDHDQDGYQDGDSSDTSLERYATNSLSGSERRSSPPARSGRKGSIKKSRICKVDNCTRYVVNKGLCIGHGGGKRCAVAGCTSSAKNMGVCWKHGGSTKCTVDNCENRAKSRGVCWSHGGGRKCKEDGCAKTAVSNGLCWAHGGGKRCIIDGCKKPAYERNGNLCTLHKGATYASSA